VGAVRCSVWFPPLDEGKWPESRGTRSHSGTRRKPLIARSRQREPPFKLIKIGESPPPAGGPTFDEGISASVLLQYSVRANRHQQRLHFVPISALPRGHHWEAVTPRGQGMEPRNRFLPTWCGLPIADICIRTSGVTRTGHQPGAFLATGTSGELFRNDPQLRSSEQSAKLSMVGRRRRRRSRTFASFLRTLGRSFFVSLSPDLGAVWRIGLASYPVLQGVT
jgi:hypothetical protein